MGNQQCNRHLHFPGQHHSLQGFFQTFPYLWSFSRLFEALKISTLNSMTFHTFPISVWTLYIKKQWINTAASFTATVHSICTNCITYRITNGNSVIRVQQLRSKFPPVVFWQMLAEKRQQTGSGITEVVFWYALHQILTALNSLDSTGPNLQFPLRQLKQISQLLLWTLNLHLMTSFATISWHHS